MITALGQHTDPLSMRELRSQTRMRTQTLCQVLATLTENGQVLKNGAGYRLAQADQATLPLPVSADL